MPAFRHWAFVLGLYAITVAIVVTSLALLFVVPMARIGYPSVVALLLIFSTPAIDFEIRRRQLSGLLH